MRCPIFLLQKYINELIPLTAQESLRAIMESSMGSGNVKNAEHIRSQLKRDALGKTASTVVPTTSELAAIGIGVERWQKN